MISDFVWLDQVNRRDGKLCCTCSLPDPDLESDDEMIVCGFVECAYDDKLANNEISIVLSEKFEKLCIGDSYQRKHFAQTIAFILNSKYGININDAIFHISDNWGCCEGSIDQIDTEMRDIIYE